MHWKTLIWLILLLLFIVSGFTNWDFLNVGSATQSVGITCLFYLIILIL